jgi:hypothetical protein
VSITVYGASDDLIEIDGDISEEFGYRNEDGLGDKGDLLAFSDGTILRIHYTQSGMWRITPVVGGSATLRIEQAPEGDEDNYSDKAELSGAVWVVQGVDYATVRGTK